MEISRNDEKREKNRKSKVLCENIETILRRPFSKIGRLRIFEFEHSRTPQPMIYTLSLFSFIHEQFSKP